MAVFASAALVLRLGLALEVPSINRPDEIFQTLEPAHRLWSGWGVMSWEWRAGIRSWLFPGLLAALMAASGHLELGSEGYLPLIAGALSLVSLGVVATGIVLGWRHSGPIGAVLCGILCSFWPDLVYFAPRTLLEVQAGNLLAVAAGFASMRPPLPRDAKADAPRLAASRLASIGALLGLVFCLRIQLAPAVLIVMLWAGRMHWRRGWTPLVLGAAVPLVLFGACDWITWGSPFQSVWKNLLINLIRKRNEFYGVEPPDWYLRELFRLWGTAVPLVAVFFALGAACAPLMAAVTLVVVISHSLVAHKEISFIYAALPPAMIVAGIGTARAVVALCGPLRRGSRISRQSAIATAAAAAFWGLMAITTAGGSFRGMWSSGSDLLPVWQEARRQPDLCGLGLYGLYFPWHLTGGYAYLNRPVPMYLLRTPQTFAEAQQGFNYLVARDPPPGEQMRNGYLTVFCARHYCLLRRDHPCTAAVAPQDEINAVLARDGE